MSSKPLSMQEFAAMGAIARARQENLRNMFMGTKLTFSKYSRIKAGKNALSDAKKLGNKTKKLMEGIKSGSRVSSAVSQLGDLNSTTQEFFRIATDIEDFAQIKKIVGEHVLQDMASELAPFIGAISSTIKAAKSWRAVVRNVRDLYKADYYLEGVLPGDPTAAAQAVVVYIKRFLAANSADAARNTAAASTKIAGLFADLGTATTAAVGATTAAAKLIQELAILGRDYKEMKAGNKILDGPGKLDLNVFRVCPILGCYLIACSDTSMIANFFVADIGLPGWMDKVERMKKTQLDPLIKNANKAIVKSHLTLDGLVQNKGTFEKKGILGRIKANMKEKFNQLIQSNASNAHDS